MKSTTFFRGLTTTWGGAVVGAVVLLGSGATPAGERTKVGLSLESAQQRRRLPLYKVIPAAQDAELTAAMPDPYSYRSWARSQGDTGNTRYSALAQITRENVGQLEVAWVYHSGDGKGNTQANPVIVDGVMYAPTVGKNIVAIEAVSGRELWRFQTPRMDIAYDSLHKRVVTLGEDEPLAPGMIRLEGGYGPAGRGLTYWSGDQGHGPRLFFMANGYLVGLDPKTGTLIDSFGERGKVASSKGAGTSAFLGAVPPTIYENIIVAPNQNVVDAFDVDTGRRLWTFNTLNYPVADPDTDNGGNVWSGMAMDMVRGIALLSVGDPHPNFIGIDRSGNNEHTNSVIALEAKTGKLLWSFQAIAHDIWDLDVSAPPNLVTVTVRGRRVDAVAQVTKQGITLLLDRVTGRPLFPYRLRRAPVSSLPGERTATYQPAPELPEPFTRQEFTAGDLSDISPAARDFIRGKARGAQFGWFLPLAVDKSTILFGIHGGAEWTGAAFDPATGLLYVSANEVPWIESLVRVTPTAGDDTAIANDSPGAIAFQQHCAACHGLDRKGKGMAPSLVRVDRGLSRDTVLVIIEKGRNAMPALGLPAETRRDIVDFLFAQAKQSAAVAARGDTGKTAEVGYEASGFDRFLDQEGYPGSKPPWGTLNAIDLNTGKLVWKVPLGEHEELTKRGIPKTGTENFGGATVTAGGLVFCAGTKDLKIRAFDKISGRELWQHKLPHGGYAPPATYEVNGRQFVVIAASGGGKLGGETGDAYVAFALPDRVTSKRSEQ